MQTVQDFDSQTTQDINTQEIQNINSEKCDCANLRIVNSITTYLFEELAKKNSTITTNTTTTTTTTTPHSTQANMATITSSADGLSPSKISAIAVGSCIFLLVLLLSVWAIVTVYRIIRSKREEKAENQRRVSSCLSIGTGEMRNSVLSFLEAGGTAAVSGSWEALVARARDEVVVEVSEVGLEDWVRVSQVGVAR